MGLRREVVEHGPCRHRGAVVANHIQAGRSINLRLKRCTAHLFRKKKIKGLVASWPGIGWLAKATARLFQLNAAQTVPAKQNPKIFQQRTCLNITGCCSFP